ncbi:hypothetical protein D6D06_00556 [Aureobasidium pullulans]|nr:hypothetical protein D6D06_00556 [Aureobasidium pullulans]
MRYHGRLLATLAVCAGQASCSYVQSLSSNAQGVLNESMSWMDGFYDTDAGYLYSLDASAALRHDTRSSAWYAIGLLARNEGDDVANAEKILTAIVDGQYKDPAEQWFGDYQKEPEEPYVGTEAYPADIYDSWDPNWRGFIGTTFIIGLEEFPHLLSKNVTDLILGSLHNSTVGDSYRVGGVDDDNLYPAYSNPSIMRAFVSGWTGRRLNDSNFTMAGEQYAQEIVDLFTRADTLSEFNSGTYTGVSLFGLTLWAKYLPADSIMTQYGERMIKATWEAVGQLWHPELRNMAGPWDRSYGFDMNRYFSLMALWFWIIMGKEKSSLISRPQIMSHSADFAYGPLFAVLGEFQASLVPEDVLNALQEFRGEHIFNSSTFSPPFDTYPRNITTWLASNISIGAETFDENVIGGPAINPSTFNPAVIQWNTGKGVGFITLHASENATTTAVSPGYLELSYPYGNSSSIFSFLVSTFAGKRDVTSWADVQGANVVFDLPQELLQTLELKAQNNAAVDVPDDSELLARNSSTRSETEDGAPSSATSCGLCGLSFPSVQEQRSHVRSDLHGYNMKQKMRGLKSVGENDFEKLVGDLDESISGSDSDDSASSDDDGKKDTTLSALLKKQANISDPDFDDFTTTKTKVGAGKPPLLWFSSSKLPSNVALGVYRTLLPAAIQVGDAATILQTIKDKQLSPKPPPTQPTSAPTEDSGGVPLPRSLQPDTSATGPHYFLCMIGGGHFAAMVVSLTPKMTKKAGVEDRAATVLAHKTFHRYTTRRKQGGSQSANDSAKGAAHSAGAGIRRYNEAALIAEVRQLLQDWKVWIDSSELLFIRATGTTNRRTLFGPYENQVLTSRDQRIRGFPFATRRATQAELMRSFVELTRVKVSTIDEAAIARKAQEEEAARQAAEAKAAAKPATPKPVKPTKEEEEASLHTTQLQALIRRSKAPALVSYITSNNLSPNFTFFPSDIPQNHHAPTPLHLAASLNAPALVSSLLLKAKADPTFKSAEGKTAFEIAGDRATRDSFRLARSELGENAFDWDSAGVPAALSKADYDARVQREKDEKAAEDAAEQQRRKTETERLRNEDKVREEQSKEKKFGKGKTLAQVLPEKTAQEKREEEARGMTPEMRMKLERERRARAAEARFKAMSGNK